MSKLKRRLEKKALKATAKHSVEGVAAKATRRPLRSVTLLAIGVALGAVVGFVAARQSAGA